MTVEILIGDVRDRLRDLPDESVHCIVTSPPYFGLRDYGMEGQIGSEDSPDAFVSALVDVFREVRRVLREDGTVWLNIGDSYASQGGPQVVQTRNPNRTGGSDSQNGGKSRKPSDGIKVKDLVGAPWMLAFALRADGWYLRQDIIWHKPNPMPESVRDRCTKAHEYIFLLAKSERYYYDQEAILEPVSLATIERLSQPTLEDQAGSDRVPGKTNGAMKAVARGIPTKDTKRSGDYSDGAGRNDGSGHRSGGFPHDMERNKRSVWTVTTQPFREAHFATFPPALIEPCILAGCPVGGTVLDPFGGAGTTGLVADRLQRNAILIELNPDYAAMAERRIRNDSPMFANVRTA